MLNYLNVIQLIIMSINMFTGLIRAGLTITRKKNPIDNFIFLMYFFAILTLTAEIINLFLCKETFDIHPICVGTWITFSLTLQQSLAFMAILQFLTFFLLQTQTKEFLDEMKKSQKQFVFFAIIVPIIFNLLNLFVYDSYYRIFYPPNNRFQVIVLFAPLTFILIIISIFTGLSIKMLRIAQDFTIQFRQNFIKTLKVALFTQLICYTPFLLIVIAAQFTNSLNVYYNILLALINTQILQYNYLFGLNPYIQKIQVYKMSKLLGIAASDIEESEQYSYAHTQTQTFTETQLTNNIRISGTPSKVAEMAISRDSSNIKSETQKQPKVFGSEKQKVNIMEMKQKAKTYVPN
ncbi:unnamed protein product [Paramecium pentaurelia]|uniref:G-protein coupled receptors family 1 profile domain-containing protein n=1 Tax=Paramecium pentaurelia TaxID=43138 RepID=A0A8S1V4G6_9CILI|nr:unnamed protein product [Paramecium pentaurelia]